MRLSVHWNPPNRLGAQRSRSRLHKTLHSDSSVVLISAFLFLTVCIYSVVSETQWVWSQNRQPHISGSGSTLGQSSGNIFPESPPRPLSTSNDVLPPGVIRIVNTQGEARLIPGAASFVSNALNNLVGREPGGGGSSGGTGGGGGGLLSIGSGFISSIPQLASGVLGLLFNRNPSPGTTNNNNNNGGGTNTVSSSPTIQPFPSSPNSGGGGGGIPVISGGSGLGGGGNSGGGGGNCKCIPLNQCFLPNRPSGDCSGGNTNCCLTSSNTRAISADDLLLANGNRLGGTKTITPTDVRVGLLENIVRGSSSVLDDALDLVLHPWLTQEDQQKVANRIANNGR